MPPRYTDIESQQLPEGLNRAPNNPRVQPDVVQANRKAQTTLLTPRSVRWGETPTTAQTDAMNNPPGVVFTAPLRIRQVTHSIVAFPQFFARLLMPSNPNRRSFTIVNPNKDAPLFFRYSVGGNSLLMSTDIPIAPYQTTLASGDIIFNSNNRWIENEGTVSTDDIYIFCTVANSHVIAYEGIDNFVVGA